MDAAPLQWLWNNVDVFHEKINDLRTRTTRNFQRPFDASQHDSNCGLNDPQGRMPCSCCKGALTFEDVRHVNKKLASQLIEPNQKERDFRRVTATTGWGVENFGQSFGFHTDRDCLSTVFDVRGDKSLLLGCSGILSRTLEYWEWLLDDAFKLIESLRAELFKSRAETQKAFGEKEKAGSECIHAEVGSDADAPGQRARSVACEGTGPAGA
jgi:hypothetical protein